MYPTEYVTPAKLSSNDTRPNILMKLSYVFANVRYIFKLIGSTDISKIGDGTLTGGLSTLNSNLKSKVKSYSYTPNASDLKSAIAVFCALRNSVDTFSSFQGLSPNMKTKYIDTSTGSVVLKDITWSKTNGTITGDISSYEVRFICIF